MELAFVLLLTAIAAALSYQRRLLGPRRVAALPDPDRLRSIAETFGLAPMGDSARGEIDDLEVTICEVESDRFRFTVDSHGRIPLWLRIEESKFERRWRTGIGFETCDRFFDDRFIVQAPEVGACALLSAEVRQALQEAGKVELECGVLTATIIASRAPAIERAFRQLLVAARLLVADTPYCQRLLSIATTDQNPFVRLNALKILVLRRGHSDEAQRALWLALDDPHVPTALFAAIRLGARVARDHLKRLARLAASADDERIAAFRELLGHEKSEEMLPLLLEASRSFYGKFAKRSLRWAVQHGGRAALIQLLGEPGATQAENVIAFLEETAKLVRREAGDGDAKLDPELEQAVLRILLDTRRRLRPAREHAARLLGAFASSHAVPALKEIGKGELDADAALAKAARGAIDQIQTRKSALSGGLALVGSDGGDLSFSEAEGGTLSEPEGGTLPKPRY